MPQYTFKELSSGNVDILENGNSIAQGGPGYSVDYAKTLGYKPVTSSAPVASPVVSPEGTVAAPYVAPSPSSPLPEPTASAAQESFQVGLTTNVEQTKTTLDSTLKAERDAAIKRTEELYAKLEGIQKETDPTKRETYDQEKRVIQNQLSAAETASATLTEDFETRRRIVGELEQILTEGNELIRQKQSFGGVSFVRNARIAEASQLIQARAGVLEATVAGLDGNIALAHNLINNARTAVDANWNDVVAYNNAVLELVANKELTIDGEHRKYAEEKIAQAKSELTRSEATADYLKEMMTDPQKARFIADAGVTLMDSVETINAKLAAQSKRQEVTEFKNNLISQGYSYIPFPQPGQDVQTFDVGGQTMAFKAPPDTQVVKLDNGATVLLDTKTGQVISNLGGASPSPSSSNISGEYGTDDYYVQLFNSSAGGKSLTGDQIQPLTKATIVLNQVGELAEQIRSTKTDPLLGILRDNNPYDVKARLIQAQLRSTVPNLARGVYGEVGVLTDTDIENYIQTLPNIRTPEEANDLILAMTLRTIQNSFRSYLESNANAGRDVSGFVRQYQDMSRRIEALTQGIAADGGTSFSEETADDTFSSSSETFKLKSIGEAGGFWDWLFQSR